MSQILESPLIKSSYGIFGLLKEEEEEEEESEKTFLK